MQLLRRGSRRGLVSVCRRELLRREAEPRVRKVSDDMRTRPAPRLHVEPTPRGRWVVRYEHGQQPLSDHLTATAAQASAQRLARTKGIPVVLLHDSYARVHTLPPSA